MRPRQVEKQENPQKKEVRDTENNSLDQMKQTFGAKLWEKNVNQNTFSIHKFRKIEQWDM